MTIRSIAARSLVLASFAALLGGLALRPDEARACAVVGRDGVALPHIDAEKALIVWNSRTHTEHFVRRADFGDAREEFAFLVPTPSRPTLGEVPDRVFQRLESFYVRRPPATRGATMSSSRAVVRSIPAAAPVTVVEERRVAGLDATVLTASDPRALGDWLRARGFTGRASLDAWLAPYVRDGFYLTAFRFVPASDRRALGAAVRLSFQTDRPFYPYAEPSDAAPRPGRRFILSVISDERVAGRVGGTPWTATTGYAGRPPRLADALAGVLPAGETSGTWMTTFDETQPRRGTSDLTFERATDQSPVRASIRP